jgi:hypothetical protein
LLPGFVSFKRPANQVGVETHVCPEETFRRLRQIKPPARRCLLQDSNRANNHKPAPNGGVSAGSVVNQERDGFDLLRQTNGFRLAGIHI